MCGRGGGAKYVVFFMNFIIQTLVGAYLNKDILLCFFFPGVFQQWQ